MKTTLNRLKSTLTRMKMRLDELPENQLVNDIKELETEAQAIKNRQFASGAYNVVSYLNQTDDEWDYNLTLGTIGDPVGYPYDFGLFFTTEVTYAFGTPFMDIFIDGHRLTQANPSYFHGDPGAVLDQYCQYNLAYLDNTDGAFGWFTRITIFDQVNIKLKYYVRSPNRGIVQKGYVAL